MPDAIDHCLWSEEGLADARARVAEYARDAGAGQEDVERVKLAVSEALTNAIIHGGARPEPVGLEARWDADRLVVLVRDAGPGMRPRLDSPGLGLGLSLIANLAEELRIRGPREGEGCEVEMRFRLAGLSPH